ncbi:oxidoreductase [Nemania sp. FL0916]|nr:oxidoreductase [Nemania sp. FL0916]
MKTILITGCSAGGIGSAIALALAQRGHHVIATARNTSKIPPTLSELPNVSILELDISSTASVQAAAKAVAAAQRGVDVIVNNAGSGYTMPILDIDIDKAQRLYDTNVWGPVRMIQAFSKLLIAKRGRVVNMNTCAASLNTPWQGGYLSSKAALKSLSDILRLELAPFGVSVVTIMAGVVSTSFHANEPPFALSSTSQYTLIEQTISGWATGEAKPTGCSPEEFAELVIDDIVGDGGDAVVWRGSHSDAMEMLSRAPTDIMDAAMGKGKGLEELGSGIHTGPWGHSPRAFEMPESLWLA